MNRLGVVVDEHVDVTSLQDVMWAILARCDPARERGHHRADEGQPHRHGDRPRRAGSEGQLADDHRRHHALGMEGPSPGGYPDRHARADPRDARALGLAAEGEVSYGARTVGPLVDARARVTGEIDYALEPGAAGHAPRAHPAQPARPRARSCAWTRRGPRRCPAWGGAQPQRPARPGALCPTTARSFGTRRRSPWTRSRFVGDPVAAVAAVDEDTAAEALDLIEVEYEELPGGLRPGGGAGAGRAAGARGPAPRPAQSARTSRRARPRGPTSATCSPSARATSSRASARPTSSSRTSTSARRHEHVALEPHVAVAQVRDGRSPSGRRARALTCAGAARRDLQGAAVRRARRRLHAGRRLRRQDAARRSRRSPRCWPGRRTAR